MDEDPVEDDEEPDADELEAFHRSPVAARVAQLVDEWTPEQVESVVAAKLRAQLEEEAFDDLIDWLLDQADEVLVNAIRRELRRRGPRSMRSGYKRSSSSPFGEFEHLAQSGGLDALADFERLVAVDGVEKRLADLTAEDHETLAAEYQARASENVMLAAFHRAIARSLGRRTTSQAMTADVYRANLEKFAERLQV